MNVPDDIRLKLDRAQEHLDAVDTEVRSAVESYVPTGREQSNEADQSYSHIVENVPEVDRRWGVMLGDFLHNARSALDHLVAALVTSDRGSVHDRHQFPILGSPDDWQRKVVDPPLAKGRGMLDFVAPNVVAKIAALQPYNPATGRQSLATLRQFSNTDKHRLIHGSVVSWGTGPSISGTFTVPLMFVDVRFPAPGTPLKPNTEFVRYRMGVGIRPEDFFATPDLQIEVKPRIPLTVMFGLDGSEDTPMSDFRTCMVEVREIVESLADHL